MVTFQKIARYAFAEPFRPFRINLAGGRVFEIRHPEMVQIGKTRMTISTYLCDSEDDTKSGEHQVALSLVDSIESLDTKPTAD
jgi:hypothetical protein